MSKNSMVVDAMIGICVHEPDLLVTPPKVVRDWAVKAIAEGLKKASLSPKAKTAYLSTQGTKSFTESLRAATEDLPQQMQRFMTNNKLDPSRYELRPFTDELRPNLKILCMAAIRKESLKQPKSLLGRLFGK